MSGEGALAGVGSFADIIEHMLEGRPLPGAAFDQRPGALEATRGLGKPEAIAARCDDKGWHVQLIANGVVLARISTVEARQLAADLAETARVAEGGEW